MAIDLPPRSRRRMYRGWLEWHGHSIIPGHGRNLVVGGWSCWPTGKRGRLLLVFRAAGWTIKGRLLRYCSRRWLESMGIQTQQVRESIARLLCAIDRWRHRWSSPYITVPSDLPRTSRRRRRRRPRSSREHGRPPRLLGWVWAWSTWNLERPRRGCHWSGRTSGRFSLKLAIF